jgi:peptide-methionine (R)-S-oxide reductase
MARATPSISLVITLVGTLVVLCGGIVVMTEYAKVRLKGNPQTSEKSTTGPQGPFAARIKQLSANEHAVTQGTQDDPPHFGRYVQTSEPGLYLDTVSAEVLFSSRDKLPSMMGRAEFSAPVDASLLTEEPEVVDGESRIRVKSKKANTRLGWKAPDPEGHTRYFLNSTALRFVPAADLEKEGLNGERKLLETPPVPAPAPP